MVGFAYVYDNSIGGGLFTLDVTDLEEEWDFPRNLCVLSKDVGDCIWVQEVLVEVVFEPCS